MLLPDNFEIDDDELQKKIINSPGFTNFLYAFLFYFCIVCIVLFINRKHYIANF
jgi:hypothetical protein